MDQEKTTKTINLQPTIYKPLTMELMTYAESYEIEKINYETQKRKENNQEMVIKAEGQLLKVQNQLSKVQNQITIEKCLYEGTMLLHLAKMKGENNIVKMLITIIAINQNFFNVGKAMNSQQCQETAFLLYEEYKHETIEDVLMMFKMAKKGMFGDGQVYNRIDGNVILVWMKEYREKKAIERENFVLKEKNNQTNVTALMEENEKPFDKDEFYKKGRELEEERKREEQEKKDKEREERAIMREWYLKRQKEQIEYEALLEKERNKKEE